MPSLRELQRAFAAALSGEPDTALRAHVRGSNADACPRIDIYRRQLHAGFRRALGLEFPIIERLVGSAYFARLARQFQAAHPSRAGDLHHIGAPFAAYLAARFGGGAYDYLAHVAQLEWIRQECMIAEEAAPLDRRALQDIPATCCDELHFDMHPACRLLYSPYPTLAIWRANQTDSHGGEIIDLRSGPTRVLAQRGARGIEFLELSAAEFALLDKIAQDCCLGAALEEAQLEESEFDPGPLLRRAVASGALSGARLTSAAPAAG